VPSSKY